MAVHWALVLAFGIAGAWLTQYLTYRDFPVAEMFRWDNWQSAWIAGATAGAIVGHFVWVISKPRQRASRAAAICALANVLVWMSFLAFSPPLDDEELVASRQNVESVMLAQVILSGPPISRSSWRLAGTERLAR